jgi:hypothetical protein
MFWGGFDHEQQRSPLDLLALGYPNFADDAVLDRKSVV